VTHPDPAALPPTVVPRPVITQDNAFWFDAAREGRLVIQRCASCGVLRHPPAPTCAHCRSFDWDSVQASGRGTLHSYAIAHHPKDSAFEYPLVVGLADLEEGVRIVADMVDVDPDAVAIDMPVEVLFAEHAHGTLLPQLRPARGAR
jgi:uncharacterized protein